MAESRKDKKAKAADADRESLVTATGGIKALSRLAKRAAGCDEIENLVNLVDGYRCAVKANHLPHLGSHAGAGCNCAGTGSGPFLADLIVLIDTSGSMNAPTHPTATTVSAAASAAVAAAKAACPVDLRIAYMGCEGIWAGTIFTTNHLTYLKAIQNPDPPFATDNPTTGLGSEEGANAIEDLSNYYDWRPGACRAIFYISDEELDSSKPLGDVANEALAVSHAVAAANANNVTIFAHHLTWQNRGPAVVQNYNDLCNQTGGRAYFSTEAANANYVEMLAQAICGSCGLKCREAAIPKLEPCISISWGDSKCDCFETDDTEVVCVTVCNCYSNLTFSNFEIAAVYVTTAGGGPVPTLPDGSASVQVIPLGPTCFGDIPPCRDDKAGCVSREFVIRTRGAKGGKYEVHMVGICYDVSFHYNLQDAFELTLCPD